MNCKSARSAIALWVGNDLDEHAERELRQHVEQCPQCRGFRHELEHSLQLLQESDSSAENVSHSQNLQDSIWPMLDVRIAARQSTATNRFNGWLPALAVSAACLMILAFAKNSSVPFAGHGPDDSFEALAGSDSLLNRPVQVQMLGDVPDETFLVPFPLRARNSAGERWQSIHRGQSAYSFWNVGEPMGIESDAWPSRFRQAGQSWPAMLPQQRQR